MATLSSGNLTTPATGILNSPYLQTNKQIKPALMDSAATRFNMTEEVRELRRAALCVCSPCSVHGVGV
ncbi:hypothetical protein J6590_090685 [Homalodisca vitripennis]|nr:hypothetical protein J6590_090685 [Homalodisca vitripennis]